MNKLNTLLKLCWPLILLVFGGTLTVIRAQDARLQLDFLNKLEAKASETVDVTVDGSLLQIASKFLDKSNDPDKAQIKAIISGLKGVYVKSYEFDNAGGYSTADVDQIRQQLQTANWARMVNVHSRRGGGDNVDVYTMTQGDKISGLAILVAEDKELTVVNIVGAIDLDKLAELNGKMGIPDLKIDFGNNSKIIKEK